MSATDPPVSDLPARALETTAERPWPVRLLSSKIADYVSKMAPVWVEGQLVQVNRHNASATAYLTLRDTDVDMSLNVTILKRILHGMTTPVEEGAHVVVHARPSFWTKRGTLSLRATDLRAIGLGELLARIEHLKRVLAAEGLFDADRKVPLPFLPARVGLISGQDAKAQHDVLVNARARWPQVQFELREVAVQGPNCVREVTAAIAELDADPQVDVIVVARGGGSVEDLLPFSNEAMVRAAAACRTPLVAAIGHETDCPLLDLVADFRASTPTDAAKRIVPDVVAERARIDQARDRMAQALTRRIALESERLATLRSRPVLAQPEVLVSTRSEHLDRLRGHARAAFGARLDRGSSEVGHLRTALRTLSPDATLRRGYAVLRTRTGGVVRSPQDVVVGESLQALVAHGELTVSVSDTGPANESAT
ncbi:exodeoxyribonuclease VII large subunit [Ruania halotolerans]|uniref:exodeoxyribonuclease VII large subunit n=1 Tax=Ruania halotolerans TaxID=2897773 RepID=UPI001E326EF8|nr:exodeoxyribonuclease VII large subunit [Ruania halotolerans]UFU07457.1 exodeoxyribonuclease VII large subunit [Ruania halotolerans]